MDKRILIIILGGVVALLAFFVLRGNGKLGQATPGSIVTLASSSQITVGTSSPTVLFDKRTGCLSRIISTNSQPLKLFFGDSSVLGTTTILAERLVRGNHQAASTTQVYDAGLYGCETVKAIAINGSNDFPGSTSSSSITISEY